LKKRSKWRKFFEELREKEIKKYLSDFDEEIKKLKDIG